MRSVLGLLLALALLVPTAEALAAPLAQLRDDGVWVNPMLPGVDYTGEFTTGSQRTANGGVVDIWRFRGSSGDCVQVHVQASGVDLSVQLAQSTPNGAVVTTRGAAEAAGLNPTYRLPGNDTYYIKITSASSSLPHGQYQLRLDRLDRC
jgi:hypothetical protein